MPSSFCTTCGTPLAEGAGFCSGCGSPASQRQQASTSVRFNPWVFLAVVLTGLFTGLFVGSSAWFFQRDGELDGIEALATFVPLPLFAALLVSNGVSIGLRRHRLALRMTGRTLDLIAVRRMAVVAYLTLFIPLLGIGIGGANVLQQMLGGAIGGGFWGLLFTIDLSRAGPISK